jgi:hypothetical protein
MRTGHILRSFLVALAFAAAAQAAFALEFGLDAATGNLQIPWAQQTPTTGDTFPTTNYFFGGDAWLVAPLGEEASVRVSYDRDPILRNTAIAAVQFERGIARISVGPLFGFLNSDSSPFSAGLTASVRLQWPGVAYVSMRSDGGTAISIFQASADPQAQTELAAGFYVPHAIVSGLVSAKRFNELDPSGQLVTDSLTRYAMTVDVFKKNVPYTALLSIGYQLLSKRYAASDVTDSLGAVVLGIDATAQIDQALMLKGGISTGAYVFGLDALTGRGPGNSAFMFSADLGLSLNLSAIKARPAAIKEEEPAPAAESTPPAGPADEASAETPKPEDATPPLAIQEEPAAPSKTSKLAIEAGSGLYYDARLKIPGDIAIIADFFNLRVGLWGRLGYRLTPAFSIGAELGIDYLTVNLLGSSVNVYDMPIMASARYDITKKVGLEAFGGAFINGITSDSGGTKPAIDLDVGARANLGGFYAEASYVIGIQSKTMDLAGIGSFEGSYARFGLGYLLRFGK